MLSLYQSSDLKSLAAKLLDELGQSAPNALQSDFIILQNNRMKRWLQKFMAREKGIAANMETEFPGKFIWKIYHQMDKKLPQTLPCEREPMQFSIFDILQSGKYKKHLRPLYDYIQNGVEAGAPERAWNLSEYIADLFDRYQIYRPEMILKWQEGELQTKTGDEKWQAVLWRILQKKWEGLLGDIKWKNRPELHNAFIKRVQNDTLHFSRLPEKIDIFAVPALAPTFLETFIQLSKITDVRFYWLDVIQTNNALTKSWGEAGREFLELFENKAANIEIKNEVIPIRSQEKPADGKALMDRRSEGGSIRVHSCHSAMREVEVLYDQLLDLFEKDPELNPEDVLITAPDVETYAPLIHAVFSSPDTGQPAIPYHIAEQNLSLSSHIQSFIKLLEGLESRFKVTDVLDLLSETAVREAFGISEEEISRLENRIDENNIRWGIDASFKKEAGLPASNHFTWQAGLNRMMLGTVMEQDGTHLLNGIFPDTEMASSEDAILIGKLSRFLHELFTLNEKVKAPKSIVEWASLLQKAVQTFSSDRLTAADELAGLLQTIDKLVKQQCVSGIERNIPFKVVHLWLRKVLDDKAMSRGGSGRGVTFSSVIAMRSIPFKIIGMIGMNDDAFPRKDISVGFDLMKTTNQKGDPDRLKEDRNLFLETLMTAKEYCYFSYVGQSNREEADFPPSVLISELLDYVQEKYDINPVEIIQKHPLQSFSVDYFKGDDIFTYSKNRQEVAEQLLQSQPDNKSWLGASLLASGEETETISIPDLISFYQNPAKLLLKNKLGLIIGDKKIIDEDREFFALYGLNKYGVKQDLIQAYLKTRSFEGLKSVLNAQDRLPEGWPGELAVKQHIENAKVFGDHVFEKKGDRLGEEIEIDLAIAGFKLTGNISDYYKPLLLNYRFGRRRAKDLVALWIKHVILNASDQISHDMSSVLLTWEKGELGEDYLNSPANPEELLLDLIQGYREGVQKIGYFFPESSFAYIEKMTKTGDKEKALKDAKSEWLGNPYNNIPGESDSGYVKWVVGDGNPLDHPAFKEAAERFWLSFFSAFNR